MKNSQSKFLLLLSVPGLIVALALSLSSCTETKTNKPAPTVAVTPTTASNVAGAKVTASVQVDSPEGGANLAILVNGQANSALPDQALDGTASQTIPIEFTIPANAVVGASYIITFQAVDKKNQQSPVAVFAVSVSAVPAKTIVDVPAGNITTNTTWTKDKIYRLNGFVRVGTDAASGSSSPGSNGTTPTTLTIEAGTVIYGKTGTPGGTLVIQRGSKLQAVGTASAPIIFTSEKAPGQKKSGDWGGVVLCGRADINTNSNKVAELEGAYGGWYGGGVGTFDNADNSGTLSYVRIEYAGYPINPNQEINGLTLGGVGSGTTLNFIQVTYANDDSFEWFGGTVNATNLIAYKGIDDDFDTDNGFSGRVQFGLGIRDAIISDQSGSNGFEADNDGQGTSNTPITSATFSNMTIIGPKQTAGLTIGTQFQNGAHLRRNLEQKIINSFITAYPTGVFIDGTLGSPGAVAKAGSGLVVLSNNILAGVTGWGGNGFGTATTTDENAISGLPYSPNSNAAAPPRGRIVAAGTIASGSNPYQNGVFTITDQQINSQNALPWFTASNTVLKSYADAGINANVFEPLLGAPTLIPTGGSPLLSGASFAGFPTGTSISSGFQNVSYKGAFGATDWTTGWTNWNPALTDYSK